MPFLAERYEAKFSHFQDLARSYPEVKPFPLFLLQDQVLLQVCFFTVIQALNLNTI